MKYLFFLVLLGNIIFFLWEMNSGVEKTVMQNNVLTTKGKETILLSSEIIATTPIENKKNGDETLSEDEIVQSEIYKAITTEPKPEVAEVILAPEALENKPVEQAEQPGATTLSEAEYKAETITGSEVVAKQANETLPEQNIEQLSCYEVGPFEDQAAVEQWTNQFQDQIKINDLDSREVDIVKDYLVYYPAEETFEQSEENINKLIELDIDDYWLFQNGDMRGAISLGLYEREEPANRAVEKYRDDGLEVKLKPRLKKIQGYFARLTLDTGQHAKALSLTSELENIQLKSCISP